MIELTKYETFLKIFSAKSAYKHVINRILPEIKALIPSNISLTMTLGAFTLPNYVDCARLDTNYDYNDIVRYYDEWRKLYDTMKTDELIWVHEWW